MQVSVLHYWVRSVRRERNAALGKLSSLQKKYDILEEACSVTGSKTAQEMIPKCDVIYSQPKEAHAARKSPQEQLQNIPNMLMTAESALRDRKKKCKCANLTRKHLVRDPQCRGWHVHINSPHEHSYVCRS